MALLQISEPGAVARPAPAAHRRRHRPRHHPFAGRRGAQRRGRVPARRRRPGDPAVGGALSRRTAGARSATTRWRRRPSDPAQHHRLGQALHGPRPGRHRAAATRCRTTSSTRARHGAAARPRPAIKSPVEVSRRDPGDAAPARRGHLRRRPVRRRHHRAGVLRRRPAPGHQGRGAAGRPQRAAPDQRADRGRDRLRPGQRAAKASTRSTTWAAAPSTSRSCG